MQETSEMHLGVNLQVGFQLIGETHPELRQCGL